MATDSPSRKPGLGRAGQPQLGKASYVHDARVAQDREGRRQALT